MPKKGSSHNKRKPQDLLTRSDSLLPESLLKSLFVLIEQNPDLPPYKIADIDPEKYGAPNTKLRKAVTARITRLRRFKEADEAKYW